MENSASRTRSAVGRVPAPGGAAGGGPRGARRSRACDDRAPTQSGVACGGRLEVSGRDRLERLVAVGRPHGVVQQRVLGQRELRVGVEQRLRRICRAASSSSTSSGRRATRNCARPDWRVPSISPSPRSSRSISASLKPSRCWASARSRGDSFGPKRMQTDACAPRPIRPRSWCSWEIPKRSAPSTSISDAFGTSMPTSITVVETSTSAPPSANAAIAACFSRGRIWPCSSTTRKSRSSVRESRSNSAVAARAWSASDSSTSGQTTKAWRPCAQLLAHPLVGARALALGRGDVRRHRPAARRQLPQDGDVEVAVGGEGQRARDRRGGHVQHVRGEAARAPCGRARGAG